MLAEALARRLWERMAATYGHKWTTSYGVDVASPAGKTWREGLADVTPDQLAAALRSCLVRADGWPPSLPEFRAMCFSIPALAVVQYELRMVVQRRMHADSVSRFARFVWQHLDIYSWQTATIDKGERMVAAAYEVAREHVLRGGALPPDPVAEIEHSSLASLNERPSCDPAVAAAAIADIESFLGIAPEAPATQSAESTP